MGNKKSIKTLIAFLSFFIKTFFNSILNQCRTALINIFLYEMMLIFFTFIMDFIMNLISGSHILVRVRPIILLRELLVHINSVHINSVTIWFGTKTLWVWLEIFSIFLQFSVL